MVGLYVAYYGLYEVRLFTGNGNPQDTGWIGYNVNGSTYSFDAKFTVPGAVPGWLTVASLPSIYQSSSRIYVDTSSVLQPLLRGMLGAGARYALEQQLPSSAGIVQWGTLVANLLEMQVRTLVDETDMGEIQRRTSLVDIAPTLLDFLGLPADEIRAVVLAGESQPRHRPAPLSARAEAPRPQPHRATPPSGPRRCRRARRRRLRAVARRGTGARPRSAAPR